MTSPSLPPSSSPRLRRTRIRRSSSRAPLALRPLSAELSTLSRADGSASLKCGDTHVLCAVHGPVAPARMNRERTDGSAEVSVAFSGGLLMSHGGRARRGEVDDDDGEEEEGGGGATSDDSPLLPPGGGATERELENFVRDALSRCIHLDLYPRCVIRVVLQIVRADGAALGTAVNCAALALLDAGVSMSGLPVASTCVAVRQSIDYCGGDDDDEMEEDKKEEEEEEAAVWLDPTAEEESGDGRAVVVLVTNVSSSPKMTGDGSGEGERKIISTITFGDASTLPALLACVGAADRASSAVAAFARMAVEQKVEREERTLWST